jgi:serine/threonine protein phosphatase PrpC
MVESNDNETETCVGDDEKSRTFRKRRLTCAKHHLATAAAAAGAASPSPEKSRICRDRRSALTHSHKEEVDEKEQDEVDASTPLKKKSKTEQELLTRTVHSGQLHPSTTTCSKKNPLYDAPFHHEKVETEEHRASKPAWRHRHTRHHHEEDHNLPFPRHVVGTYSCHGVEPVYGSDYEDDDDDEWGPPHGKPTKEEKLTTVAKINQDRGGVAYPYANCNRTALFAAYDGHGQGGELVSQFALHEVQKRLEKHPLYHTDISKAFKDIFVKVDDDLKREPLIEPLYAGTTACVVLIRDQTITISNVGDSRAVLAKRTTPDEGRLEAIDLSEDQNPDTPDEQKRIELSGGFVSPPPEEGLSARVWLDQTYSQIGLAMARSIGDHAVAPVGVIAEPVVTSHTICEEDDFIIIATDGVWEFIDSQEAVRIVGEHLEKKKGATNACQALIEAAANKWHNEEGNYRDDITALVVRLQDLWST